MARIRHILLLPVALALLAGPACVRKSIGVRSDPPGAAVYIDGVEAGRTPVDFIHFDFYGTREVALYRDGYLVERRLVKISPPWYEYFPIDIFSELVVPWNISDRRYYYFDLKPALPTEETALMRNAHDTREEALARIESARLKSRYRPRAYVVEGEAKKPILWGPFVSPPRAEPIYTIEKPKEEPESKK